MTAKKQAVAKDPSLARLTDEDVIARVLAGEIELFELIIRRYNQRLFRVTLSVLKDEADAEDAMQEAYVAAFGNLSRFRGEAKFSTWLTKIAVYEALARLKKRRGGMSVIDVEESIMTDESGTPASPEKTVFAGELRGVLERDLMTLPNGLRAAYVLRDVEAMSTAEAAACLDITEDALKMRLSRARSLLRTRITDELGSAAADLFTYQAPRCDRMVAAVFARITSR
jgi:RNA polymerase sigma-70 factor (ECF subfamily)